MQLAALDLPPFRILRIVRGRCMAQLAGEDSLAVAAMRQHMPSYVDAAKAVKRFAKRVRLAGNDAMAVQALLPIIGTTDLDDWWVLHTRTYTQSYTYHTHLNIRMSSHG